MIFCSKCGKEYSKNALSCPNCGNPSLIANRVTKSNTVALLLCLFFGTLGIHRFYLGKVGTGLLMLVLSLTGFGLIISAIWALIDLILIICQQFTDKNGYKLQFN